MYSKRIFILIIILCVVIAWASTYFLFVYRGRVIENKNNVVKKGQEAIHVEDKKITDATKPFNIEITYPHIDGQEGLNKEAEAIVKESLENFKKNSLENDAAVKETDLGGYKDYPRQYDLKITYTIGQVDDTRASFMLNIYEFTGGAHGNGYYIPLNYNLQTHEEITLSEVFPNQPDYLKKVSEYAITDLKKQAMQRAGSLEGLWIEDGAAPEEENFLAFQITESNIVFYFSPYQVAPYALGSFEVTMPIEQTL